MEIEEIETTTAIDEFSPKQIVLAQALAGVTYAIALTVGCALAASSISWLSTKATARRAKNSDTTTTATN